MTYKSTNEAAASSGAEEVAPTFDMNAYFDDILHAIDNLSPFLSDIAEPNEFKVQYAISGNVAIGR